MVLNEGWGSWKHYLPLAAMTFLSTSILLATRGPVVRVFEDGSIWLRSSIYGHFNATLPPGWVAQVRGGLLRFGDGSRTDSFVEPDLLSEADRAWLLEQGHPGNDAPAGKIQLHEVNLRPAFFRRQVALRYGFLLAVPFLIIGALKAESSVVLWAAAVLSLAAGLSRVKVVAAPPIQVFADGSAEVLRSFVLPLKVRLRPGWSMTKAGGKLRFTDSLGERASLAESALGRFPDEVERLEGFAASETTS